MSEAAGDKFCIQSNQTFMDKQSSVFNALNVLESNHSDFCQNQPLLLPRIERDEGGECIETVGYSSREGYNRKRAATGESRMIKQWDNANFGFRAPRQFRQANVRRTPDHKVHPERWTKYSLADVSEDQLSDKSNTAAAMSFLREVQQTKSDSEMDIDTKPIFNKPIRTEFRHEESGQIPSGSGKIIMPEYVVGSARVLKKEIKSGKKGDRATAMKVNLDHLNSYEEEEECEKME